MSAFFEASKLYNICSSSYPNYSATFRDQLDEPNHIKSTVLAQTTCFYAGDCLH